MKPITSWITRRLAREGSALVRFLAIISFAVCIVNPAAFSQSYRVSEVVSAHGAESQLLGGNQYESYSQTIAPDLGGQAKSWSFLLSANVLTEEYSLFLDPPPFLALMSQGAGGPDRAFVWQAPGDAQFSEGYRLKIYSEPNGLFPPEQTFTFTPSSSVGGTITYFMEEPRFAELVSFRGAKESSATKMVLVPYSLNVANGDANGDGVTNGLDLAQVVFSIDTLPGQLGWNPGADQNGDGRISSFDVLAVSSLMGWRK